MYYYIGSICTSRSLDIDRKHTDVFNISCCCVDKDGSSYRSRKIFLSGSEAWTLGSVPIRGETRQGHKMDCSQLTWNLMKPQIKKKGSVSYEHEKNYTDLGRSPERLGGGRNQCKILCADALLGGPLQTDRKIRSRWSAYTSPPLGGLGLISQASCLQ